MRVLVAGSSGVVGQQVMPVLDGAGHEAIGLTSRPPTQDARYRSVVADALDQAMLTEVVDDVRPDAVVHLMTAIPQRINPRKMTTEFLLTNRLRTEGTRNLIGAATAIGVSRILTQGLAYAYQPGQGLADEETPLWTESPVQFQSSVAALQELERRTVDAGGLVLRFGHLYGPRTAFAKDGAFLTDIEQGKLPLVGGGHAVYSFTHTRDAAMGVLSALDSAASGALNIVDDDPAPMHEWLPELAQQLGARAPRSIPAWVARMAVGGWGVAFMNKLRGADNARARLALDWRPGYQSWRDGFAAEL